MYDLLVRLHKIEKEQFGAYELFLKIVKFQIQ